MEDDAAVEVSGIVDGARFEMIRPRRERREGGEKPLLGKPPA